MTIHHRRSGRNGAFRFDVLESRQLLSAVSLSAHDTAATARATTALHQVIVGTYTGRGILHPTSSTTGSTPFTSTGTAIGPSTYDGSVSYSAKKSGVIKYTKGESTLADASGDQINESYTGSGKLVGSEYVYSVKGTVKGGSGIYAGAKGSFSGNGTTSAITGDFEFNVKITLKRL